jgi:hypothetical protein
MARAVAAHLSFGYLKAARGSTLRHAKLMQDVAQFVGVGKRRQACPVAAIYKQKKALLTRA